VALTLVPEPLARVGYRFVFAGPNPGDECDGCPYQRICFGLEPGRAYEVVALRDVIHPCALHDSNRVQVAEVEERPFWSSVEAKRVRGTATAWTPIACGRPQCVNWALCHPIGPSAGAKHEIVEDAGDLPCPAGYELRRVALRKLAKN
jgi:uncharacterized protein